MSLSTPEGEVNILMQQVAEEDGLEVSVGLPKAAGQVVNGTEKVVVGEEDNLGRQLAELQARR